jgi:hypothetical protein
MSQVKFDRYMTIGMFLVMVVGCAWAFANAIDGSGKLQCTKAKTEKVQLSGNAMRVNKVCIPRT